MAGFNQQSRGQQGGRGFRFGRGKGTRVNRSNFKPQASDEINTVPEEKSSQNNASAGRRGRQNLSLRLEKHAPKEGEIPEKPQTTPTTDASRGAPSAPSSQTASTVSETQGSHSTVDNVGKVSDIRSKEKQIESHQFKATRLIPSPQLLNFSPTSEFFNKGTISVGTDGRDSLLFTPSPFERLPGELRWKIYEYIFTGHRVEVLRLKDKDPEKHIKRVHRRLYNRLLLPRNPETQAIDGRTRRSPLPSALLFTCRTMYRDTLCLLYANVQFVFNTTRTVTRFLKTTNKDAQMAIRHIELNHVMYSEPALLNHRWWKVMSDMAWCNACDDLRVYCKSLKVLHVDMAIRDWPIDLEVGERWSLPLLAFARYGPVMDWVDIRLRMPRFSEEKLRKAAREIEERVMEPTAFQIREDGRLAKELAGPIKAKVLRLVF